MLSFLLAVFALAFVTAVCAGPHFALGTPLYETVVLSRSQLGAYTSAQALNLGNAVVTESGHFGSYVYNATSTAAPDGNSVIIPSDSPASGRWLLYSGQLTGSIAFTIAPTGGDFTDIFQAQSALNASGAAPNTLVTENLACATKWTFNSSFRFTGGGLPTLKINGCAPTTHSITGIVSSSGTPGNYSVVLQMGESVSNVTANNDYIIINDASGNNCQQLDGGYPVTAVNSSSNQLTISDFTLAASLPSACTAAAVFDLSSVLYFTDSDSSYSGISILGYSNLMISNLVILGNGTEPNGLAPQDNGRVFLAGPVVVDNFKTCMEVSDDATIQNAQNAPSGGLYCTRAEQDGIIVNLGGMDDVTPQIVTGTTAGPGVYLDTNGVFFTNSGDGSTIHFLSEGNSGDGVDVLNGAAFKSYGESADNGGYGIRYAGPPANVNLFSFTNTGNANGTCNGNVNNCSAPLFANGLVVNSGQNTCWGNDCGTTLREVTGSNAILTDGSGLLVTGKGVDFDTSYVNFGNNTVNSASGYYLHGVLVLSAAAPTISSGFGLGASIPSNNGAASFSVNVGTGGTASSGVIAIGTPHAAHAWNCGVSDLTSNSSFVTDVSAVTNSSVTLTNYSRTTGAVTAWNPSDTLAVRCIPY